MFSKFYEIPSLPFQDIEKPKRRGRTDNVKTVYTVCGGYKNKKNMLLGFDTVNFLNIRTPKKFVVITLKFELCGYTIE